MSRKAELLAALAGGVSQQGWTGARLPVSGVSQVALDGPILAGSGVRRSVAAEFLMGADGCSLSRIMLDGGVIHDDGADGSGSFSDEIEACWLESCNDRSGIQFGIGRTINSANGNSLSYCKEDSYHHFLDYIAVI